MKFRIFIFLPVFFLSVTAHAQLTIFGGPQYTSAKYSISNTNQPTTHKPGFMAGVGLRSLIEGPLYFAPSLTFSRKGYEVDAFNLRTFPPDSGAINVNTSLNTIELAPLLQFNFSKSVSYMFMRIGPAVDFAISGHESFDSTNGKRVERDMPFGFGEYGLITTAGILHLGYQHKSGLTFLAHYAYGLSSLNNADGGPRIQHRIAGMALGWKFGKKK